MIDKNKRVVEVHILQAILFVIYYGANGYKYLEGIAQGSGFSADEIV